MANGDLAFNEGGFTPVKNTDDFRLGYDRINEVADLAIKRGMRTFPSKTALQAVQGLFDGALAATNGVVYRWTAGAWVAWDSDFINFTPQWSGLSGGVDASPGWYSRARWRYRGGSVLLQANNGIYASQTGQVLMTLPVKRDNTDLQTGELQAFTAMEGRGVLKQNGTGRWFPLELEHMSNQTQVGFRILNTSFYLDGLTVANGDSITFVMEYSGVRT